MGIMARNMRSFAVLRRCTASLAILTAAFSMAGGPDPAHASSIASEMMVNGTDTIVPNGTPGSTMFAYYQLTNPSSTTNNDLIVSSVVPPNSVEPIDATTSPLSIVHSSFGFDPKNLQVFLSPPSTSAQAMAIEFANGGLAPGGTLNFKVSLASGYDSTTAPILAIQPPNPLPPSYVGPTLTSYTPAYADAAPGAVAASTPEPVSLALWSALAGAGMLRARAFRRARLASPTPA